MILRLNAKFIAIIIPVFFLVYYSCPSVAYCAPLWMIGQVVVTDEPVQSSLKKVDFFSTGFIFKDGSKLYFITTAHTIKGIRNKYGSIPLLYAVLPNVPQGVNNIYRITLLFVEASEDSAVFSINDLTIEGDYSTQYKNPINLPKGEILLFIGYPSFEVSIAKPKHVKNAFISCAVLRDKFSYLGCENTTPEDIVEIYTEGYISSKGMSGSPVFEEKSDILVGILKGHGDDSKDKRVSDSLGVSRFNIIRPLNRTISRIRARK